MTGNTKKTAILRAADTQFAAYGYRRTSMEDIAQALEISRASVYTYFQNKDDLFRHLAIMKHSEILREATAILNDTSSLSIESRLTKSIALRHGSFLAATLGSEHGDELYDEHHRLCGDIVIKFHKRFQNKLAETLRSAEEAGELDLKSSGIKPGAIAEILHLGALGLKNHASEHSIFVKRVSLFVKLTVGSLMPQGAE